MESREALSQVKATGWWWQKADRRRWKFLKFKTMRTKRNKPTSSRDSFNSKSTRAHWKGQGLRSRALVWLKTASLLLYWTGSLISGRQCNCSLLTSSKQQNKNLPKRQRLKRDLTDGAAAAVEVFFSRLIEGESRLRYTFSSKRFLSS